MPIGADKPRPFTPSANFANGYPTPGPQNPTAQSVFDHVFFLSDTEWQTVREEQQFDYIVVGSGICALAFVERILSREPTRKILILERGPFFLPEHFQNLPISYQLTIGGSTETFPWTLSGKTVASQASRYIGFQRGMIPFFGGRSLLWSCWCPRPLPDELQGWPQALIDAAYSHFDSAEALLRVVSADKIDSDKDESLFHCTAKSRPVYGRMQLGLQLLLQSKLHTIPSATRCIAAPLAAASGVEEGIDFAKFAVPEDLLRLVKKQAQGSRDGLCSPLLIKTACIVDQILEHDGRATALSTSQGVVNVGDAKLVLAMGTLPPTTLLANSFSGRIPDTTGERFTAHFITSIVARVPRKHYSGLRVGDQTFDFMKELADLELAAIYMAGKAENGMQYHVQLSVLSDKHPVENQEKAARYMPDVVATASAEQLSTSQDYLVFVCAALAELYPGNEENHFRRNQTNDLTTNSTLQCIASDTDLATWDTMDKGSFEMLTALSPKGADVIEYWNQRTDGTSGWTTELPTTAMRRVPGLVHEASTLWIGDENSGGTVSPVGLDYRPRGVENVYVTGGGLFPTGGSWNPTLTMVAITQDLADKLDPSSSST